jgi:hypothetical protein
VRDSDLNADRGRFGDDYVRGDRSSIPTFICALCVSCLCFVLYETCLGLATNTTRRPGHRSN